MFHNVFRLLDGSIYVALASEPLRETAVRLRDPWMKGFNGTNDNPAVACIGTLRLKAVAHG